MHSKYFYLLVYFFFRYKERLKTKYLKGKKPSDVNKTLQGSTWTFLVDGLDDFRDGLPPEVEGDNIVVKVNNGS